MIEPFPEGAVAQYGPHQAIFSADLNAEAVFDIQASDGRRIRGGIRAIQMTDLARGETITIGTVKKSVRGQLLPPNQILYADAFDGIQADVLLVWNHNLFSHDVILREQPDFPAAWNPATVRLEVLTEFLVDVEPELRTQVVQAEGQPEIEDDAVIHFGRMAMVMGKAFQTTEQLALGGLSDDPDSVPVLKQWFRGEGSSDFLVESIRWLEVWQMLKDLPVAGFAVNSALRKPRSQLAKQEAPPPGLIGSDPEEAASLTKTLPIRVAPLNYRPRGCVLDFVIIPDDGTPTTLQTGFTYYVKTSYYSGSAVTFQPGCVIKFKNNANMLLYGPVSFPSSGEPPVFTSRNDNNFGEVIGGVAGEVDSDGDPSQHRASKALWIYYVTFNTTVQNDRFRWAQRGIQYDQNYGVTATHTVLSSLFEYTTTGLYVNIPSGSGVMLNYVKKCGVSTEVSGGAYSGSMYEDCGVVSVTTVNNTNLDTTVGDPLGDPHKNSQSECSFVVVNSSRIVASFLIRT